MPGFHDFGQLVALHLEDLVFEFLGKFSALIDAEKAALALRAAIGKPLGDFAEVLAVLDALERGLRLFFEFGEIFRLLSFGVNHDLPQRHLLRAHEFGLVRFVILRYFFIADGDVRADLAADHPLRQQGIANVVLEILPVHSRLPGNRLFELLHARQIVLSADGIEPLDEFGFDAHAHVLGALHQERLVDEVAQSVLLTIFDVNLQLFRRATILAFRFGVLFGSLARLFVLRTSDDFIVDARNDLFDGLPAIRINRFRRGGFRRLFGFCVGRRHPRLPNGGRGRRFRLTTLRLLLCGERQRGRERHDDN